MSKTIATTTMLLIQVATITILTLVVMTQVIQEEVMPETRVGVMVEVAGDVTENLLSILYVYLCTLVGVLGFWGFGVLGC